MLLHEDHPFTVCFDVPQFKEKEETTAIITNGELVPHSRILHRSGSGVHQSRLRARAPESRTPSFSE